MKCSLFHRASPYIAVISVVPTAVREVQWECCFLVGRCEIGKQCWLTCNEEISFSILSSLCWTLNTSCCVIRTRFKWIATAVWRSPLELGNATNPMALFLLPGALQHLQNIPYYEICILVWRRGRRVLCHGDGGGNSTASSSRLNLNFRTLKFCVRAPRESPV